MGLIWPYPIAHFLITKIRIFVLKYRAEIDGLRALAVIPVILFHAGFEVFSGGFVGVDIFFVISGYLITTILIEDIENNRLTFLNSMNAVPEGSCQHYFS